MITDYKYAYDDEKGEVMTIYEDYESRTIRKSICSCVTWKNNLNAQATCRFYDNERELTSIQIPNHVAYSYYQQQKGIIIADDGKMVVLPWSVKNSAACYSIATNSIVWNWSIANVGDAFVYGEKVFAVWLTKATGGVAIIDLKTGATIGSLIEYSTKLKHPSFHRLNERYLVIYICGYHFLYDLLEEKLLLSKKRFVEPSDNFKLRKITTKNLSESIFCFAEFKSNGLEIGNGGKYEWVFTETLVKIADLLDDAVLCKLADKLPTTTTAIENYSIKNKGINKCLSLHAKT